MKRLSVRLSLAFLLSAWVGIGAMVLSVQRTVDASFRQYVNTRANEPDPEQITRLENYYVTNDSWEGVETVLSGRGSGNGGGSGRGATFSIADQNGIVMASTDPTQVGKHLSDDTLEKAFPLMQEDTQVGWLFRQTPGAQALGSAEVAFLEESNRWLTVAGVGATLLALVVGSVFAWTLARPLRELTYAARDLSVGQLGRQVQTRGTVEVETLAAEFNTMSQALAEAETLRQRMAADVAHELRTPVTVLRGYLEAMLDGVYPLDTPHIAVAHDQVIHLAQLVEDLRVLTLAEAKRLPLEFTQLDPTVFISQMMESFEPLALDGNIHLTHEIAPNLPSVKADFTRIRQVLSNLLTNALRHTPAEGEIALQVITVPSGVRFSVSNTGSQLSDTDAVRVFQPFWRADAAVERDSAGSGLGLAISREIVVLHGGSMVVESSDNRVTFVFILPTA
ncbi:MAG: HAMP domain-containing protein [Anaerolineae bacterium]|nr:HAMP domain-containing protein [Anaerolineae bacterium]